MSQVSASINKSIDAQGKVTNLYLGASINNIDTEKSVEEQIQKCSDSIKQIWTAAEQLMVEKTKTGE